MSESNGHVVIDLNTLTLGDLEAVEEVVGGDVLRQISGGSPSPKALVALVWVVKRKADPAYTLDDARSVPLVKVAVQDEPASPKDDAG